MKQKEDELRVTKLVDLKRNMGKIISEEGSFPQVITFTRGIEFPKYRITIEEIEENEFVDAKGTKWIKAPQ